MTSAQDILFFYPSFAAPSIMARVRAPDFGDGESIDRRQVIDETAAGNLIVFDRGPVTYHLDMTFELMPRVERNALENFFNVAALGARRQFEFRVPKYLIDTRPNPVGAFLYTGANFETGVIEFHQARDGWFETSISVRATGRTEL